MRNLICWMAVGAMLVGCLPVDGPTPQTIETIVATVPPDRPSTPDVPATPTAEATIAPALSTPGSTAPTGSLALIDQASEFDASQGGWWSIRTLGTVGQTFTPSFGGLDAIEVWIEDQWRAECTGTGPGLQIHVREAGLDGSIVGTSLTVTLRSCFKGVTHFDFPDLVPLTPGKAYWFEITPPATGNWGVVWQQLPDSYPTGATIVLGKQGSGDLWFRTGLAHAMPRTQAYCDDGLWQHLRRIDGAPFSTQDDCLQAVNAGP